MRQSLMLASLLLLPVISIAGDVEIINATANPIDGNRYHIEVTLRHNDTGWDHYANAWRVFAPDGTLLGERTLYHPHVNEQPFTRGLTLTIPAGISQVEIEAEDLKHGIAKRRFTLQLDH